MTIARMFWILILAVELSSAQVTPQTTFSPTEPMITQIRKSVVFIKLICKYGDKEYDVRGTGFFISYPEKRMGPEGNFVYLVTNRHVAACWNDSYQPMQVENISIKMNRLNAKDGNFSQEVFLNQHGNVPWVFSQDNSVDLALISLAPNVDNFDFKTIPFEWIATHDLLSNRRITEGEPVFFAGFFYQFQGIKRIQPIIRQGFIAMLLDEKLPFVNQSENLYLADVHAFGGNSGAPVFINLSGMHGGNVTAGEEYRLLGVVNGSITEDEHFNLEMTSTLSGTARANSGISTIVPADELKALLLDPRVQKLRDDAVKSLQSQK